MLGFNLVNSLSLTDHVILRPSSFDLNCLDSNNVSSYIGEHKPDIVIHSAARVGGISENLNSPYIFFKDNMLMGINIIEACAKAGVKNLINISSTNIYPDHEVENGYQEDDILSGKLNSSTEAYGLAKGCTVKLAEYASTQFSLSYRSIICSNIYGEYDSFSISKSHIIPAIIRRLHEAKILGLDSVEIWGDGSAIRGFLFAEDLANFIVELIEKFKDLPQNINVSPIKYHSVYEINKIIAKIVGYHGKFHFNKNKPGGSNFIKVNNSLAISLGWNEKTSIEKGIEKTYKYYLETLG